MTATVSELLLSMLRDGWSLIHEESGVLLEKKGFKFFLFNFDDLSVDHIKTMLETYGQHLAKAQNDN